ncbi:MAG TPA: ABC transporter substrate-binding protein [Polyangia bacterium]|nr:ABC transporter substrate-binding protein [Polyangia bacterium]
MPTDGVRERARHPVQHCAQHRAQHWKVGLVVLMVLPVAAPVLFGGAIRGAIIGARGLSDSRLEGQGFPKRIVDPAGDVHVLASPPVRIASTFLAADEILAALVDPGRVAAVSRFVDAPETSNAVGIFPPSVTRIRAEAEQIVELRPDLVFVTSFTDVNAVKLLQGAGVPLLRFSRFDALADVLANVRLMGAAIGAEREAEVLIAVAQRRIEAVRARVSGRSRVRVLLYDVPAYSVGAGTLIDDMIDTAGGVNVVSELGLRGPVKLGLETVLSVDPAVIIIPRYAENIDSMSTLARNPAWTALTAVRTRRVYHIPASALSVVSHHAVAGLEHLAAVLHPETKAP